MTHRLFLLACLLGIASNAQAQDPYTLYSPVTNLATLFTGLFGPQGLRVDSEATLPGEQPHSAHFNNDFESNFDKLTTAIVGQLVTVPLPSPASGFTYEFDPATGVFRRTTGSFGPILAERADTIGAGRFSFGAAFQRFRFQTVEGLDLSKVPAVFTHDSAELLGGRQDVVTTINSIDALVSQFTTYVTVGVTDRFDVSAAMKVITNDLKVRSDATIQRLGTIDPLTHFYRQADGDVGVQRIFRAQGSATGLGDVTIRMKATLDKRTSGGVAAGLDIRLPTGDQMNLLGTGTAGLQPFVIVSSTYQRLSPHANASYQWNGSSILAGNPATGESAEMPDQIAYAVGADLAVDRRLTLALDLLGRTYLNAERLGRETFHARDNVHQYPNIVFSRDSFNALSGSVGIKINVAERLLFDGNLLFALDDHGVRDRVVPLLAFEYAF
jgi:outer membrane putative beta-barrel porin/alpha-amylase